LEQARVPLINLHPGLPGKHNGAGNSPGFSKLDMLTDTGAIERAYKDYQEKKIQSTGVMVHYVTGDVDCGKSIIVEEVEINSNDTLNALQVRKCRSY